jgi:hypothetical protein
MAARAAVSPASTVSCFAGGSPCCAEVVAMPKANYRTGSRETLLQKACSDQNYRVSVAVVGVDGLIKVQLRGDGVGPHSLDSSRQKAYTAATFKRSTAEVEKGFRDRPERGLERLPNMLFVEGGLPIKAGEEVVGGDRRRRCARGRARRSLRKSKTRRHCGRHIEMIRGLV